LIISIRGFFLREPLALAVDLAVFQLSVAQLFEDLVAESARVPLIELLRHLKPSGDLMLLRLGERVFKSLHVLDTDELMAWVCGLPT